MVGEIKILKNFIWVFFIFNKAWALDLNASFKVENESSRVKEYSYSLSFLTQDRYLLSFKILKASETEIKVGILGNMFFLTQKMVIFPYSTDLIEVNWTVSDRKVDKALDKSLLKYYLPTASSLGEKYLISTGLIKKLNTSNEKETLERISKWINNNIQKAGYSAEVLDVDWTLKHRKGDCTEQAILMVAMAREAGMPARVMGGYIMEKSGRIFAKDYHNWAEVYVDDRWIIVDPYYRVFDDGYNKYIAMQIVDYDDPNAENRRFWIEGAEGVTVKML